MFSRRSRLFIFLMILFLPLTIHAASAPTGFLDKLQCINNGICGLDDIALGFVELIKLLLGLMGSVALVYFVWGGIVWITSGGNMEKVSKGRNIMINTVLAIIVSFSSYIILNFFVNNLLGASQNFAVNAECSLANATDGANCKGGGIYQCYKGSCLNKCERLNRIILDAPRSNNINDPINVGSLGMGHTYLRGDSLACETVGSDNLPTTAHLTDYCPGDNTFVCVFRRHGATKPTWP